MTREISAPPNLTTPRFASSTSPPPTSRSHTCTCPRPNHLFPKATVRMAFGGPDGTRKRDRRFYEDANMICGSAELMRAKKQVFRGLKRVEADSNQGLQLYQVRRSRR